MHEGGERVATAASTIVAWMCDMRGAYEWGSEGLEASALGNREASATGNVSRKPRLEARTFLEKAGGVPGSPPRGKSGYSFLDRPGGRFARSLLQLLRETEQRESGPDRTRDLLNIARELMRCDRLSISGRARRSPNNNA